ncbi:hypothetical protein [Advenella mimigardefordensis]|uniref:hypothetical protein n=1 Tax=Advenella mimigardefordensis TaxID=302406 RepID=UPI00046CB4C2|nr:hypothetical protein [Advenella mimigardefordensis]
MSTATMVIRVKQFLIKERFGEMINLALYIGWAIALLADGRMLDMHAFRGFAAPAWTYGLLFVGLVILTSIGLFQICWCRKLASISMMAGSAVWLLVAVQYWYSYPPFQPEMQVCPILAIMDYFLALEFEKESERWGDDV